MSNFKIIPAIDIFGGKCVRLTKGDYDKSKVYNKDPVQVAQNFKKAGIKYIHIVDLDGARIGEPVNLRVIENIIKKIDLQVQVGGGIRAIQDAEKLFNVGVSKIIIGSMLVRDPQFFKNLIQKFGDDKIIAGIDVKNDKVAISGWEEATTVSTFDSIQNAINLGANEFVITDINKDGMLIGPNLELYKKIKANFHSIKLIASGGVSSQEDIDELGKLNLDGVIVGKAIYEGKIEVRR